MENLENVIESIAFVAGEPILVSDLCVKFDLKPKQVEKAVENLKKKYDLALIDDRIVGLSIGTRPDCVDENKLDLIASYTDKYETWIEYGLQSANDETLKLPKKEYREEWILNDSEEYLLELKEVVKENKPLFIETK